MTETISTKIIRNTVFNGVSRVWSLIIGIVLTPYIVMHLGAERFALWSFVGVLTGYISLFDCGVGTAFVKHIAEFNARNEFERIVQLVATGIVFYLIFGLVVVAASGWFIEPLIRLFKIPPLLHGEAVFVFFLGIGLFAASNALSPLAAIQPGLQRMDISARVGMALSVVTAVGTVWVLENRGSLRGLMLLNAGIFAVQSMVNYFLARRLLGQVRFTLFAASRQMFSRLFSFGYKVQIARIASVVTMQTDKILIASFVSLAMVTFYQLGNGVIYAAGFIPSLLVSAFMPAFSEMEARGERQRLLEAYQRSTKYVGYVALPLFIFLAVCAPVLFQSWMGWGYSRSAFVLQVLSFAWVVNAIAQVGASVCMAVDYLQVMAFSAVLMIGLNVVISVVLVKIIGFYGVAWGTLIAVNAGTVFFLVALHRKLALDNRRIVGVLMPSLISALASGVLAYALGGLFDIASLSRIAAAGLLFLQALVFSAGYLLCGRVVRVFDRQDIVFFNQRFAFLRPLLRLLYPDHG